MLRNEQIYEALVDEDAFRNLPALFADAAGARSSMINWFHSDGDVASFAYSYFSPDIMQAFVAGYLDKDLWGRAVTAPGRGNRLLLGQEMVPDARWERSEIYNELIRPYGDDTFHSLCGSFASAWGVGLFGLHRGKFQAPFSHDTLKSLEDNAVALRRVLAVRGEMEARRREADLAKQSLDLIGAPTLTVRFDHYILHANLAAETALRHGDALYVKNGCLHAHGDAAARKLSAAIAAATDGRNPKISAFTLERPTNSQQPARAPYQVTASPITNPTGRARALILFRDPNLRDPTLVERVKALYQLTSTEAELAVAMAEGSSVAEFAAARRVRESTVRSQVKALAAKMNCSRQAEIAACVATIPPLRQDH